MSRSRSRSPRSPRKAGDEPEWRCKNCTTNNLESVSVCVKCRLPRGKDRSEVFKEDWECCRCGAVNFSRRIDCYKCHTKKPPIDPKFPDDWICPDCKGVNFSKRTDCYKCRAPKPAYYSNNNYWGGGGGGGYRNSQPSVPQYGNNVVPDADPVTGETHWMCRVCGVSNFYARLDCYRCFEMKPGSQNREAGQRDNNNNNGGNGQYPNDPSALTIPGQSMGGGGGPVAPSYNKYVPQYVQGMRKNDWVCPACEGLNFSRRLDCYKCRTLKPEEISVA